jgi:hypothetical protein
MNIVVLARPHKYKVLPINIRASRRFGSSSIVIGNKAITITRNNGRRDADVIVCQEYRNFQSFSLQRTSDYVAGVVIPTQQGELINYPKQHSANLTTQHQATRNMLKPMIRILKNMRNRLVQEGSIANSTAPSYFIEGMLYNVPPINFVSTYGGAFCNCINWLWRADRSTLLCPNRQYLLLSNSNIHWAAVDCEEYLHSLINLWNSW